LPAAPLPPNSQPPGAVTVISILQSDGSLLPAWRQAITRFPDRFLFAMDLTEAERPKHAKLLLELARNALAPLGAATEGAVANGNVQRLYRNCPRGFRKSR